MRAVRFAGAVLRASGLAWAIVILSAVAQAVAQEKAAGKPTGGNPPKSNDVGLPLPKPPPPTTVTNPDGSTTTTSYSWGGQTTAVTVNSNGETVSTVTKTPLRESGQRTSIVTGSSSFWIEYDSKGTIRKLRKTDLDKGTTNVLDYDDKGQLVRASVFQFPVEKKGDVFQVGQGGTQQVYDVQNTPSGSPERYNNGTNKFERIKSDDWDDIRNQLNSTAADIKSIRDQFAPVEKPIDKPVETKAAEPENKVAAAPEEAPKVPWTPTPDHPLPPPKPDDPNWKEKYEHVFGIDPCLIGTWECTSFKEPNHQYFTGGGTGFRVTFSKDGTETVDYSNMQRIRAEDDEMLYEGKATAQISTKDGVAKIEKMIEAGVKFNAVFMAKRFGKPWNPKIPGLGPGGLGSTKGKNNYKCTEDSLEYQSSSMGQDAKDCTVKLTKVKP